MKNVYDIDINTLNKEYNTIAKYDAIEIDCKDNYSVNKIFYLNRLNKLMGLIARLTEKKGPSNVLDIGCAQGNLSLLLAEKGYIVDALDLRPEYLEYSKLKYEKGNIRWLNVNIMDFIPDRPYDFVILGEILEHCAYPEIIIARTMTFLKSDGILLVTTPNGNFIRTNLPSFSQITDREELARKQYGPEGIDHLFLFTIDELSEVLSSFGKILFRGYIGSIMINKISIALFKLFNPAFAYKAMNILEIIPYLNKYFSPGVLMVVKKHGNG